MLEVSMEHGDHIASLEICPRHILRSNLSLSDSDRLRWYLILPPCSISKMLGRGAGVSPLHPKMEPILESWGDVKGANLKHHLGLSESDRPRLLL